MAETIKVKLQPLTAEAFRPYGHIVDEKHPAYPEVEAHIDKGVWHIVATLGGDCRFFFSTRLDPPRTGASQVAGPEEPLTVEQLIERQKQKTSYIEFVDVQKRDNRVIELEL